VKKLNGTARNRKKTTFSASCEVVPFQSCAVSKSRLVQSFDWACAFKKQWLGNLAQQSPIAQDLQFSSAAPTIRNRNRPAKQVGGQRWLNQHS
jgi:hypothetical protein